MAAARSRDGVDETRVKPRSDAYVGLLGLSLLALTAAMLFAYLNWKTIEEKPKPVQMAPAAGGGNKMPSPPGPGVAAPQGQMPPGNPPQAPGNPPQAPGNPPPQQK